MATYLGLSADELAAAAQIDPSAMQDRPSSPGIQRTLRDFVRTLSIAGEIFESSDSAIRWLMSDKVSAFRGKTALALVSRGRTEDVILYLRSIESGFVG